MAGPFRNPRIATLFVVVLVHVVIQQIDGYPRRDWWNFNPRSASSRYRTANIHGAYRPFRALRMPPENDYSYSRRDDDRPDELTTDLDDGEDDVYVNVNDRFGNVEEDAPEDTKTNVTTPLTEDAITQLIKEAVDKHILLSPQEWDETLAQNQFKVPADEGTSAKVQKVRSPRGPSGESSQTTESNRNDQIFFPGSKIFAQPLDPRTVSVPICEGAKFCTHKTDYPSDNEIKETLNRYYLPPVVDPPLIAKRFGSDDKDALCPSERITIKPTSGLDNTNTWRIIFNNEEYVQLVNVEICSKLNEPCPRLETGYKGYPTKCEQKHIYRHLVGLGSNGTTELIPFELPSSCCCQLIIPSE